MWHLVPGDPDARRGRVRPGKWDLEKEAEKPGQRVQYGVKTMEPWILSGVVWGYTGGREEVVFDRRSLSRSKPVIP